MTHQPTDMSTQQKSTNIESSGNRRRKKSSQASSSRDMSRSGQTTQITLISSEIWCDTISWRKSRSTPKAISSSSMVTSGSSWNHQLISSEVMLSTDRSKLKGRVRRPLSRIFLLTSVCQPVSWRIGSWSNSRTGSSRQLRSKTSTWYP